MAELEQFLQARVKVLSVFMEQHLHPYEREYDTFIKDFEKYAKSLIRAKKTGNYRTVGSNLKKLRVRESVKENHCPNTEIQAIKNDFDAIKVKTEKLSDVAPKNTENAGSEEMPAPKMIPPRKRQVKKEKESINVKNIRGHDNYESKRATRSRTTSSNRNSDVIIQNTYIPSVDISDSDEEKVDAPVRSTRTRTKKKVEPVEITSTAIRSTRTRTKAKQLLEDEAGSSSTDVIDKARNALGSENENTHSASKNNIVRNEETFRGKTETKSKRERSQVEDTIYTKSKRSKSDSNDGGERATNASVRTEYEDAVSDLENRPENSTFVYETKHANRTTVVVNSNAVHPQSVNGIDELLTDDESFEEQQKVSPQKGKKAKEVFSPYDRSPVKKKVEAFEKLRKHDVLESTSKANTSRMLREIEEKRGNVKEKAKGFTPVSSKTLYKNGPPSSSKIGKYVGYKPVLNDSMPGSSRYTPVKLTKTAVGDYREKEQKRQEREKELKRQDMMKFPVSDDKKKTYEERLLRIQQQKEGMEREKLKVLEAQRLREEKHKLLLQKKEEKQRQLKEENEKKRLLAKQRAEEKRKEEESLRLIAQQEKLKNEKVRKLAEEEDLRKNALQKTVSKSPIYMIKPAPYLPCDDCMDSDEEEYKSKRKIPEWAIKSNVHMADRIQTTLGHRIKNTFFSCQNQRVDLVEIFERIESRKLKRSSSAYWKKPPRFTMVPVFQER